MVRSYARYNAAAGRKVLSLLPNPMKDHASLLALREKAVTNMNNAGLV